ncbi:MAG: tetratricopeptide repeat protein [Chloracidobacterium sp.]|nr:tetratricopeptide repeat protein [Chloracidobacterium sp.]
MKNLILVAAASLLTACMNTPQPIPQNSNSTTPTNERSQTSIAHGPNERQPPAANSAGAPSKWTQSGDAIDTSTFDAAIAKAEKAAGDQPSDTAAKKGLAEAYLARANALTGARQYASALGDYRRTLKHDPTNAEAKDWVDQIINIYKSINRGYPAEGEEPPPLPFTKGK